MSAKQVNHDLTPNGYNVGIVESIDDLLWFCRNLQDPFRFVFRGQSDAEWKLETRVERNIPDFYRKRIRLENRELEMLERFKRRAHHYLTPTDIPTGDLEWLALIQHYGGPTRLLDFTRSLLIAAYFAVGTFHEKPTSAIWAVNWQYMRFFLDYVLRDSQTQIESAMNKYQLHGVPFGCDEWIRVIFMEKLEICGAFATDPFRQNKRLMAQQGVFIMPIDISRPFIENLAAMFEPKLDLAKKDHEAVPLQKIGLLDESAIIKMIIPQACQAKMRTELRRMNIITETLFPDLVGEATALADIITAHVHVPK